MSAVQITPRIRRMRKIIATYNAFVSTYASEGFNADCRDETFVLDMLYGIGIAIDKDAYYAANGFEKFKAELRRVLT